MTPHTLWFEQALLPGGWAARVRLTLAEGRINAIEHDVQAMASDDRHAIGLPGMSNLHSHAFQRAMAGLTEKAAGVEDSFWGWRDLMYRFTARIGPVELQAIAALAYIEMLESGFTQVGEFHYLHHAFDGTMFTDPAEMGAAICAAAAETGIGMTLLPVFYAHSGFGGAAPLAEQRRFTSTVSAFSDLVESSRRHVALLDGGVLGLAPHSLRAVTPAELSDIAALGAAMPMHIHIAEQVAEVEACVAALGRRPVAWLLDTGLVDDRWCLVHATHLDASEISRLATSRAVAGLCPLTEANLGDGIFPAVDYLSAGGRFGVGSDSNVLIQMGEELRWLEYAQRLTRRSRNLCATQGQSTGMSLFSAAVRGGGQALGVSSGLAIGNAADIVSLKSGHPTIAGKTGDEIVDGFIFAAAQAPIDCVWRYGRKQVKEGRHRLRERILADYPKVLEALRA